MQKNRNLLGAEKLYKKVQERRGAAAELARRLGCSKQAIQQGLKDGNPSLRLYEAAVIYLEEMKQLELRAQSIVEFKE